MSVSYSTDYWPEPDYGYDTPEGACIEYQPVCPRQWEAFVELAEEAASDTDEEDGAPLNNTFDAFDTFDTIEFNEPLGLYAIPYSPIIETTDYDLIDEIARIIVLTERLCEKSQKFRPVAMPDFVKRLKRAVQVLEQLHSASAPKLSEVGVQLTLL